jgi:uncharacterized protein YndB with AHSA1/START domain
MIDTTTLRMERSFQAPAQAVFDAWTSEEVSTRRGAWRSRGSGTATPGVS